MILLTCPCGHSVPFPEESGNYKCTRCGRTRSVTWYEGPNAYEQWYSAMVARALPPTAWSGSVKKIVTSQHRRTESVS